jgi:undecaprenyl-diphosphatase
VLTSELFIGPVKSWIDRARPPGALIETTAASFPSGHAIATAVTAVGLVLVLAHPGPGRWRWEVNAVVFTSVMALSRVYLRAHWLSDTVAGALLGAGLALGWPALLMAIRHQRDPTAPTS